MIRLNIDQFLTGTFYNVEYICYEHGNKFKISTKAHFKIQIEVCIIKFNNN